MTDIKKIQGKLEALRNKTVENGCTEAEALSAANKMAELLARHGLTEEQLDAMGYDLAEVPAGSKRDPLEVVWMAVSRFADCTFWLSRGYQGNAFTYFGRPQDVLVAQYVHDVLQRAFKADLKRFKDSPQYTRRRLAKTKLQAAKAFTAGWANSVAGKVYDGLWRRFSQNPQEAFRLMNEAEDKLKQAAADGHGVDLRPMRALAPVKGDVKRDRYAGHAAGSKVEVGAGIGAGATVSGLLG